MLRFSRSTGPRSLLGLQARLKRSRNVLMHDEPVCPTFLPYDGPAAVAHIARAVLEHLGRMQRGRSERVVAVLPHLGIIADRDLHRAVVGHQVAYPGAVVAPSDFFERSKREENEVVGIGVKTGSVVGIACAPRVPDTLHEGPV